MRRGWGRDAFVFVALFSLWNGDGMRDLLSWWGFGALSLLLLICAVVLLVVERARVRALLLRWDAAPLLAFGGLCLVSVAWSAYPVMTLATCGIQIATSAVAVALLVARPTGRLVAIFGWMLHVHLLLALLFEVVVPFLPDHRLAPFFTDYGSNAPGAYYWSQGLLFTGGRIQGIAGNANLTCFIALLGAIVVGCLLAARRIGRRVAIAALALDLVMMALTRSATVLTAAVVVIAAIALVLGYRHTRTRGRIGLAVAATLVVALASVASSRLSEPILRVLGKGDDLTGRLEIWRVVGHLVGERPVLGWGWIGWWAPWVAPYDRLVIRSGVEYLQAHNAFLDVELQLGVPGLLVFACLVGGTVYRALRLAVVPAPLGLLPLLLAAALLAQGIAESRLLIEGNWALLVMLALGTPWPRRAEPDEVTPEVGGVRALAAH